MRITKEFLTCFCEWCDSRYQIPWVIQHEALQFCPACTRQTLMSRPARNERILVAP